MLTQTDLILRRVTPAVGAVVEGVDLGEPCSPIQAKAVRAALLEHGVLFFRGQAGATAEQLWAFLGNFGTPNKDDSFGSAADTAADVHASDFGKTKTGTAIWHSDATFLPKPPKFTLLRAVRPAESGGDTLWASMTTAYDALARPVREMLDGLSAIHSIDPPMVRMGDYGETFAQDLGRVHPLQQAHPVVQLNPETGRKALYVNESCVTRIVDMPAQQSRHILAMLFEHIKSPDYALRWTWSAGDVAFWDNRSVQHYAVPDYDTQRIMQRIVVAGDRPMGPR